MLLSKVWFKFVLELQVVESSMESFMHNLAPTIEEKSSWNSL